MDSKPEDDLEELRQRLEGLQSLLKFPPWVQVVDLIEKQAAARSLEYKDKPLGKVDDALIQNFQKGVVAGMRLAIQQPKTMVEILREQFNTKLEEERARGSQQ
jgi:hypothetical protein